jgi:hypothetical protein
MAGPQEPIKVEIDPNAELPKRYLGTDEDGPHYGPMTLYECIIAAAVDRLVGVGTKQIRELIAGRVQESVVQQVDEALKPIIAEALTAEITVGDGFSERKTSVQDAIGERVREQTRLAGKHSYNRTVLDEVIREQIDYGLKEVFTKDVAEAKAKLRKSLTDKAAELLAAESLRDVGIR